MYSGRERTKSKKHGIQRDGEREFGESARECGDTERTQGGNKNHVREKSKTRKARNWRKSETGE